MGTNYEYNTENFEEILSRLQLDEAELLSKSNSEDEFSGFDFSQYENLGAEGRESNSSRGCCNSDDNDYDYDAVEVASNGGSCSGVVNCRQYYEKGLREGLAQGFTRGYQKGYCKGKEVGVREGFNAGLEKGLSRAEELAKAAYEKGLRCGYQKGYAAGYQKGYQDGCKAGFAKGVKAGYSNGFRSGYEKAVRDIIRCANAHAANNGVGSCSNRNNGNSNSNCGCNGSWRSC